MKKLLVLLPALAVLFALAGCADSSNTSADSAGKVGISMPSDSLEHWSLDGSCLEEQFRAAGYEVLLTYSDNDITQQNDDISDLIDKDVDLLIIAAVDGESLAQTLDGAETAGIPVIAYDRLIMNTDAVSYYVTFGSYAVGVLQARFVIDTLGLDLNSTSASYNIEFTAGDPADSDATYCFNGAFDTLRPYIDAGILNIPSGKTTFQQAATPEWSTDTAYENMQNILASYYSNGTVLDVALCPNDSTALGVAHAITTDYTGSNLPLVTGQGGDIASLRNIVNGLQSMTVYKNVSDEAAVTVELGKAILAGETPAAELVDLFSAEASYDTESYNNGSGIIPSYLLVPYVITAGNLDLLADTGLYVWDDGYLAAAS